MAGTLHPEFLGRQLAATGAAVATACGSSYRSSEQQLASANKAAGWKEEAGLAADGGVHQAGREEGGAVVPAKSCLVPLGPAALRTRQGRAAASRKFSASTTAGSETFFGFHNFPPHPKSASSASAWQESPLRVSIKKVLDGC